MSEAELDESCSGSAAELGWWLLKGVVITVVSLALVRMFL